MQGMCQTLWRENCGGIAGEVAGENFPVDVDQSFGWLLLTLCTVLVRQKSVSVTKTVFFAVLGEV